MIQSFSQLNARSFEIHIVLERFIDNLFAHDEFHSYYLYIHYSKISMLKICSEKSVYGIDYSCVQGWIIYLLKTSWYMIQ